MNCNGLVYLATPYFHDCDKRRNLRFEQVTKTAARLMQAGFNIFSPITHSHPIAEISDLPTNWEYWREFDRAYLRACRMLIVLKLPGWEQSRGVTGEIEIARELGLPIVYMEPEE